MPVDTTLDLDTTYDRTYSPVARLLPAIARIAMGLIFLVMGLNGFLQFLPQPATPFPARALAFMGALFATGYMIPLISGTQVVVAVLLLSNRFVPLALTLIAPVIVNIMLVHLFLAPLMLTLPVTVLVLELYLAWAYRGAFRPMLAARVAPSRPVD